MSDTGNYAAKWLRKYNDSVADVFVVKSCFFENISFLFSLNH